MAELTWTCKPFDELNPQELYAIMRLRSEVFVVEQQCVFLDADDVDQHCHHLMGETDGELAAYSRLVPAGVAFQQPSIGRFVTDKSHRKLGFGKLLMERSIEACETLYGKGTIKIGAQLYLKRFYESFGFVQEGDVYDEDGINHIHMLRHAE